ncbi:hypothetical protein [Mycobacterium seoulense]|uniref:Uncharacterized protein n=1 Tax=Mycobacterium seoulense TaxID=386911 RepID=A0A7I7P029_9MYCO|nr:hypothetical protein [Mycobacterium seoulense]MCV7436194.1 hypothetical protein [Mycobacterium seoulense]BBY01168.1 hypothetical protein MSEO_16670 [Mycobacterium seoulense]
MNHCLTSCWSPLLPRDWPDPETHRAKVRAELAQLVAPNHVRLEQLERRMSLAVHLGTYESAVDNMMRRIGEQDPRGSAAPVVARGPSATST